MRFLSFLFLMLFAGAVAAFAYYNQQEWTLQIPIWKSITAPGAVVIGVAYVLGMLSGWSVWGMLRRSLRNVSDYAGEKLASGRPTGK
jgi:4-hydroxybenzoate polyprenyltransferase